MKPQREESRSNFIAFNCGNPRPCTKTAQFYKADLLVVGATGLKIEGNNGENDNRKDTFTVMGSVSDGARTRTPAPLTSPKIKVFIFSELEKINVLNLERREGRGHLVQRTVRCHRTALLAHITPHITSSKHCSLHEVSLPTLLSN